MIEDPNPTTKCLWIMEAGPRKGQLCDKPTPEWFDNTHLTYCSRHNKISRRRDWGDERCPK